MVFYIRRTLKLSIVRAGRGSPAYQKDLFHFQELSVDGSCHLALEYGLISDSFHDTSFTSMTGVC